MKPVAQVVLTGALVGGAGLAAWTFLPKLQSPGNVVGQQAEASSEKARRLIDRYDPSAEVARATVDRSGYAQELSDERISALIEDDSRRVQDVLDQEAKRINEMLKSSMGRLREHDQKFDELSGTSSTINRTAVNFGNNENAMSRNMSQGLSESMGVAKANTTLLKQASSVAAEGLGASIGEASGRDSSIANRTHGVALYHEGLALDRQARIVRSTADSVLKSLALLQNRLNLLTADAKVLESSGIVEAISKQKERLAEAKLAHDAASESIGEVESKIESIKAQIEQKSVLASTLRQQLDALEARGLRYESPSAGDDFGRAHGALSSRYRTLLRETQALQHGTISGVQLEAGGDYVTGEYVPEEDGGEIEYTLGLDELERRKVQMGWTLTGAKQVLDDETAELGRLEDLKAAYSAKSDAANALVQEAVQAGQGMVVQYLAISGETFELENDAIAKLDKSKSAFGNAKRALQTRMADLPKLAGEKETLSPQKLIKNQNWLIGQMVSQSADAATRASMVLYDRYTHLARAIALFEAMGSTLGVADFKIAELTELRAAAKSDAEALLDDAIDDYESAGRQFKQHWSVAASVAAADYMLALFDHPELVDVAIANYQSVVKDRETESRLRPFVDRLEQLRKR